MGRHRSIHAFALALVVACSGHYTTTPTSSTPQPKLVVMIVIDQLPLWVFEQQRELFKGGFARLWREAAYAHSELPYANSYTACGHATLGTGAPPSVNGVPGNQWYRRAEGRERSAEYDRDSPTLSVGPSQGGELTPDDGTSSRALRVDGIADALRTATNGRAHSVAIALKGRAAVFVAGKRPDLAIWYEAAAGGMTTSKHYAAEPPAWLVQLARERPASRFFERSWEPLDREALAKATGIPDENPGEGDNKLSPAFPHSVIDGKNIVNTPFADELELDVVYAALDAMQLGADDVPDLLAVSFNAHDHAGHVWGPDSWEVLDLTMRLDTALGELFDTLDKRLGKDGWAAVVTSDHGATPLVERTKRPGSRRIPPDEIGKVAEEAMRGVLGDDQKWIADVTSSNVWLAPETDPQDPTRRGVALDAAVEAILKVPNIAAAGRTDLFGPCMEYQDLKRALCLSYVPGESGELYVVPEEGSLISEYKAGTHHDAPFDDNRLVPLFVKAPGLHANPVPGLASSTQVAPTVCALLGIKPPPTATEKALFGLAPR